MGSSEAKRADPTRRISVLRALGPYLEDIVLIGGWVPTLYQRYGGFPEWESGLALTEEADVLLPSDADAKGRKPLAEILEAADFEPLVSGEPAAVWRSRGADRDRIEFRARPPRDRETGRSPADRRRPNGSRRHWSSAAPGACGLHARSASGRRSPICRGLGARADAGCVCPPEGGELRGPSGSHKRARTLAHLRDIMRGGTLVLSQVKQDIDAVLRDGGTEPTVSEARGAVRELLQQRPRAMFAAAVREVSERERITDPEVAAADLMAHFSASWLGCSEPDSLRGTAWS